MIRRSLVAAALASSLLVTPGRAGAEAPETALSEALDRLAKGAHDDAIDRLESLADTGASHPDLSYDRAVAYVERARSPNARPGDLGRAVAALEETLLARPDDAEAERALERVRGEIARRRARAGAEPVVAKTTLGRAVVGVVTETTWTLLAAFGSALLTLGLALRSLSRSERRRLAATTGAAIGALILIVAGGLSYAARSYRLGSQPAVVVVGDARLLDADGKPLVQKGGIPEHVSMPEGTSLFVKQRQGTLLRIEWGSTEACVQASQVRLLTRE